MGSKKKAALHGLSKKEGKALEKKAEALRAELNAAPLAAEEWSGAGQARGLE